MQTNIPDYSTLNYWLSQIPSKQRTKNNLWRMAYNGQRDAKLLDKAIDEFWAIRYPNR